MFIEEFTWGKEWRRNSAKNSQTLLKSASQREPIDTWLDSSLRLRKSQTLTKMGKGSKTICTCPILPLSSVILFLLICLFIVRKVLWANLIDLRNRLLIDGLESVRNIFLLFVKITSPDYVEPGEPDYNVHDVCHWNTDNSQYLCHYSHSINHSCVWFKTSQTTLITFL